MAEIIHELSDKSDDFCPDVEESTIDVCDRKSIKRRGIVTAVSASLITSYFLPRVRLDNFSWCTEESGASLVFN